jgi:polyphosphate kinase
MRQDYDGLRRYVHIGTGNYHAEKAREFSDIGLLTCDGAIGRDATELFNYLTTGFSVKRNYKKLLLAPESLKKTILKKIMLETALHMAEGGGQIRFKLNALEDRDIVEALYRASMAGVRIDLIVRDTCRLRPGVAGLSDNIRVISLMGRFMEHSRIYYFSNNGTHEYLIGSADLMKRNLEARVELLIPVEEPELKRELRAILDLHDGDQRSAWDMGSDGTYVQRQPSSNKNMEGSHRMLIVSAEKRSKAVMKIKKIKKT